MNGLVGFVREMSKGTRSTSSRELLHEVNSPDHQPESPITLDEFWRRFEELVLPNKKYSTKRDMSNTYRLYFKPEFGSRQMKNISRESLQLFFNRLLLKGELAYGTRMKVKMYLRSIFTHAVKYGYLTNNKVRSVDLGQKPPHIQPDLPTTEELKRIEEALPDGKYRMFFQTSMGMGARAGEVPALRWRSLDLDRGIVWIRQTVYEGRLDSPKTHRSARPVYIPEELVQKLREYRKQFPNATDDDFVFPSPDRQDSDEVLKSSQALASSDLQAAWDNPNHLAFAVPLVGHGIGRKRSSAQDAARTDGAPEHRDDDEVLRSCSREIVSRGRTCHRPRHGSNRRKAWRPNRIRQILTT